MNHKIRIQLPDGRYSSWVGYPDVLAYLRALEKCEIKSFEISQIPYQQ